MVPFHELGLAEAVLVFVATAAVVVVGGVVLARTGDEIASRTGLGGVLVGSLLLAGATSLPEITTSVAAAADGEPDLAIGNLFGSGMANMGILAAIDLMHRGQVWARAGLDHARLASIAIALTAVPVIAIAAHPLGALGPIGGESLVVVAGYVMAAAWMRRSRPGRGRRDVTGEIIAPTGWARAELRRRPLRWVGGRFAAAALVVLVTAPVVAVTGGVIADRTGMSRTFVGTLLLAATTSLPELVASVAAIRIGAYELAVGNLFGSNAFNMIALLAADLGYSAGPILAAVSTAQIVAGTAAILLMALALAAVVHGGGTRIQRFEPDAALVLGAYVVLLAIVYGAG